MPTEPKKLLRGTMVLTLGRVTGYGLSFLRNLILARMLAKADYALAAVFGMAMMLLEVSGRMSFSTQVIQSKQGDTPGFQASAHALQFVGGLCSAVLLATLSVPMAGIFDVPHIWWAFASLAIVPLSQGLGHLDIARRQRNLDYLPLVIVDVVPQLITTLAVWPLAVWLQDYRVILWIIVGKSVLSTAFTFIFSEQPYRWAWDRLHIRSMLTFGWPLLLTGLVMFASQQADQLLVGSVFSLSILANYALAYSLVSIPWFIFSQVAGSLMLPLMARAQDDTGRFRRQYRFCVQTSAVASVIMSLWLILVGEQLVTLLYGGKYQGTGGFVALLGTAFALRFLRFAPAVASSARGDTINHLYSNLWRAASLPVALGVVTAGGSPLQIAACAVAGELLAAVASVIRLSKQGVTVEESSGASIYLVAFLATGTAFALLGGASLSLGWAAAAAFVALIIAGGTAWVMFPETAHSLIDSVRRHSPAGAPPPTSTGCTAPND